MVEVAPPRPAAQSRILTGGFAASSMLGLIAAIAMARRDSVPTGRIDPWMWWHVGRASGLIAWALLGVGVIGGMTLSTSLAGRRTRSWATGMHTFIGALGVVFTGVHMAAVLVSDQLGLGWLQLVVPFTRADAPVAQACGVVAGYLLLAVAVTSWLRGRLPWRWWRRLHLLAFPMFGFTCAHAVLAGSDADHPVMIAISGLAAAVILMLIGARLVGGRAGAAAGSPAVLTPAGTAVAEPAVAEPVVTPTVDPDMLELVVTRLAWEADGVVSLSLSAPDGAALPEWEPGAHLELALPSGRLRHYSLYGEPTDRSRYRIAVLRQEGGRGGSREIHVGLPAGSRLRVRAPRNNFRLEPAAHYLFVAGGIGITGVWSMAEAVAARGSNWSFVYGGRDRDSMAFIEEVLALGPDRVEIVPQDERGFPDLPAIIAAQPEGTAVYCCGPPPLLDAVARLVDAREDLRLHVERFSAAAPTGGAALQVELRRSGLVVDVGAQESVLQAVRRVLPAVPASCEQGVCGSCRSVVLAGEPEHRDQLLSDAERAAGQILICVSRARGDKLALDL